MGEALGEAQKRFLHNTLILKEKSQNDGGGDGPDVEPSLGHKALINDDLSYQRPFRGIALAAGEYVVQVKALFERLASLHDGFLMSYG